MSGAFTSVSLGEVARLIDEHPFAWIVARADPSLATPMPMLVETGADGAPVALVGHLPRAHTLVAALLGDPAATFLFQGPHGYITPAWLSDQDWAPTWNFAIATIDGDVTFDDVLTDAALAQLVAHMERGPKPWTTAAMGDRYAVLRSRVIGFRVAIGAIRPRFKLGQDEKPAVRDEILSGLGDVPMADWMRRFGAQS